jgi:hypothetical protein
MTCRLIAGETNGGQKRSLSFAIFAAELNNGAVRVTKPVALRAQSHVTGRRALLRLSSSRTVGIDAASSQQNERESVGRLCRRPQGNEAGISKKTAETLSR